MNDERDAQSKIGAHANGTSGFGEMEKLWGKCLTSSALDFADGRKLILFEFERTYTLRLYNPHVDAGLPEEMKGVQINLSRETMYALTLIYMCSRPDERDRLDRQLFWEKLAEAEATKLRGAFQEIGEAAFAASGRSESEKGQ